ncbi:hypothetical protein AVEN_55894-1, partial [Araneus ventricosus]
HDLTRGSIFSKFVMNVPCRTITAESAYPQIYEIPPI